MNTTDTKRKAVLLDRDGTIIIDKIYLNDPNEIHYLPQAIEGIKAMNDAGYQIIVVTNQSGVPRGLVQEENLHKIHQLIAEKLSSHGVDINESHFYYAPHLPDSNHPLRKPDTGMLDLAAQEHHLDLQQSWMIGDRMTDVEAGHRAGTQSIFLKGTESPDDSPFATAELICDNLVEAANFILDSKK